MILNAAFALTFGFVASSVFASGDDAYGTVELHKATQFATAHFEENYADSEISGFLVEKGEEEGIDVTIYFYQDGISGRQSKIYFCHYKDEHDHGHDHDHDHGHEADEDREIDCHD